MGWYLPALVLISTSNSTRAFLWEETLKRYLLDSLSFATAFKVKRLIPNNWLNSFPSPVYSIEIIHFRIRKNVIVILCY